MGFDQIKGLYSNGFDFGKDFAESGWDDHLPRKEFPYSNSYHASNQMAPFEALYGRRRGYPIRWFEIGEEELIGPNLVHQAMEKVKGIGVQRGRLGILEGFPHEGYSAVWYEREIGSGKVVGDSTLIVPVETLEVNKDLTYEKFPVAILDRQVRKLSNKEITSMKVLWRNQQVEEATQEAEEETKKKCPHLFE
ncbi:PREDICTED: uncharacterized protein LOC109231665 [Nicotiana attenuata]|uniref:uncharacterized protein LOC109231665 n=1 Tax=Nicotiana attenuata TaxID=49451 RepID=UPI0009054BB4|nr:PREDICTED: uncharacterized protein LOC109231665 [Nicotiana attenuata]